MFDTSKKGYENSSVVFSEEEKGKLSLLKIFLFISTIPLFGFAVVDFLAGNYLEFVLEFLAGLWMAICLLLLGKSLSLQWVSSSMATILGALFLYLAAHGDINGSKIYYAFIYPVFTFYLQGTRIGIPWNIAFFVCLLVILYNPFGFTFLHSYSAEGNIRFLVAYLLVAVLSFIYEKVRNHIQLDLEVEKDKLAHAHALMETANAKLQLANEESSYLAKEANRANQAKSEFLANMSHELRTPLNGIVGMAHLMQQSHMTQEQQEFATIIRNSSNSLLEIINDILDFSKIEAGKFELENLNFDLNNELERFLDTVAFKAHEKSLEIASIVDKEVPSQLGGDPGRLRQVLINLVGNAIKFTETGEVILRVLVSDEDKDHVTLRFLVSDTGIGISPENIELLFKSFSQIDSSATRKYGGTGLGLMICKRLAEMMGGQIGVESEVGIGSTFWFTARFARQAGAIESMLLVPEKIQNLHLLAVEDNEACGIALQSLVATWGISCEVAKNSNEAIEILKKAAAAQKPIDIILINSQLGRTDGIAFARELVHNTTFANSQRVLMSPLNKVQQHNDSNESIFSAQLTKPVKSTQLYECLAYLTEIEVEQTSVTKVRQGHNSEGAEPRQIEHSDLVILLVEDNEINQFVALKILMKLGYLADAVSNGKEALRAMQLKAYDIVLMDCQMPIMDGYEATKIIRTADTRVLHSDVPIIAMTAHAIMGDELKCLDAGMSDYLSKPVEPEKLAKILKKWSGKTHKSAHRKVALAPE